MIIKKPPTFLNPRHFTLDPRRITLDPRLSTKTYTRFRLYVYRPFVPQITQQNKKLCNISTASSFRRQAKPGKSSKLKALDGGKGEKCRL